MTSHGLVQNHQILDFLVEFRLHAFDSVKRSLQMSVVEPLDVFEQWILAFEFPLFPCEFLHELQTVVQNHISRVKKSSRVSTWLGFPFCWKTHRALGRLWVPLQFAGWLGVYSEAIKEKNRSVNEAKRKMKRKAWELKKKETFSFKRAKNQIYFDLPFLE